MRLMMVTAGKKNIRGIQPAAKAHFENGEIHVLLREIFERHGRDTFEIGGMSAKISIRKQLLDEFLDLREHPGELFIADFFAVDADALIDSLKMRRSIEPRAHTRVAEN